MEWELCTLQYIHACNFIRALSMKAGANYGNIYLYTIVWSMGSFVMLIGTQTVQCY